MNINSRFAVKLFYSLIFFLMLLAAAPVQNIQAKTWDVSGYYKNFFVVFDQPEIFRTEEMSRYPAVVTNRLRLDLQHDFSQQLHMHIAYNFTPRIQDPELYRGNLLFESFSLSGYRFDDLNDQLYRAENQGSFGIFHNFDRAYLRISPAFGDLYIGRQVVSWGTARVINPTDIIAPYSFSELDTEEKRGVDALRFRIPLGFMGEIDLGAVAGKNFAMDQSAFFFRTKFYYMETDVSLLAVSFRENIMLGTSLARAIEGAGTWIEAAYTMTDPFKERYSAAGNYLRVSAGADYSFNEKTYGFVEAHYNQAGDEDPENYLFNFAENSAYSEGAVYLFATKYVIPGINYQITPLLNLTLQALYNVDDESVFFTPSIEYSFSQNVYIGGGAYFGVGENPGLGGFGDNTFPLLNSEFGSYPDFIYSSFRIYF